MRTFIGMMSLVRMFLLKLQVVKSPFVEAESVSWQDLFGGFVEIYAIIFFSGIQFMMQLLNRFESAEVFFGGRGISGRYHGSYHDRGKNSDREDYKE